MLYFYNDLRFLFQIYLCEDLNELYEAYFRDFKAEGIDQAHKLFTGSWRVPIAAKYLGLSPEVLTSGSSFVLVKLIREKATQVIGGDLRLKPEASESLRAGTIMFNFEISANHYYYFTHTHTVTHTQSHTHSHTHTHAHA